MNEKTQNLTKKVKDNFWKVKGLRAANYTLERIKDETGLCWKTINLILKAKDIGEYYDLQHALNKTKKQNRSEKIAKEIEQTVLSIEPDINKNGSILLSGDSKLVAAVLELANAIPGIKVEANYYK